MKTAAFLMMSGIAATAALGQVFDVHYGQPQMDRWMYPFNSTPGVELRAPVFGAIQVANFDDRDSQMLIKFDTSADIPTGMPLSHYKIVSATVRVTVATSTDQVFYDPTPDLVVTSFNADDPSYVPDSDPSKPVELYGVGYRNGYTAATFLESSAFGCAGFPVEGCRNVYAMDFDSSGTAIDISRQVRQRFDTTAWAIGTTNLTPGAVLAVGTVMTFNVDFSRPQVRAYFKDAVANGKLMLDITTLQPASGGPGGGTSSDYPSFATKEGSVANSAKLDLRVRMYVGADFNADGVVDFFDYLDFVDAFASGQMDADFNEDNVLDFFDYLDFVDAFSR